MAEAEEACEHEEATAYTDQYGYTWEHCRACGAEYRTYPADAEPVDTANLTPIAIWWW